MPAFTDHVRRLGEPGLAQLLVARPDLAAPPPSSVRSLAARAANRSSLDRALARVDQRVLTVLEATLALTGTSSGAGPDAGPETLSTGRGPGSPDAGPTTTGPSVTGPTVAEIARATGTTVDDLTPAVEHALGLALLWPDPDDDARVRAAPGLDEALGPYPAGLGPTLASCLARRSGAALSRLAADLGIDTGPSTDPTRGADPGRAPDPARGTGTGDAATSEQQIARLARYLARESVVNGLLDRAPAGARAVLEALTWGPPVGRSPGGTTATDPGGTTATRSGGTTAATPSTPASAGGPARTAVDWLLRHGLLAVGDPQHVILPREVALALRDGRTHRTPPEPPSVAGTPVDPRTVDAESAHHAEEMVRLVTALLTAWGKNPPGVLRSGGLGSRELRRLAAHLDLSETATALVVETAGAAGLVADDGGESPVLAPTPEADDWLRDPLPERWLLLADAWLDSDRAAWLVGTRDDRGALRSALDPDSRRAWAPRLRRSVLGVLAQADDAPARRAGGSRAGDGHAVGGAGAGPRATAVDPATVHEVLRWRTPRSVPPARAVEAVIAEAGLLGVLGAGAVGTVLRALLAEDRFGAQDPDGTGAARALAAVLPPAVDDLLLQGDLTGIVPGRPSAALAQLLDDVARVESRGAALTVRFTETSVRRGLDAGRTAQDLLTELGRFARTGVPQPLEYLVLDAGRRHGRTRVGVASSYLRSDDPALLAGLTEDASLRGLGLLRVAPTVLAAQAPAAELLAALRAHGLSPVAEDPTGQVVVLPEAPYRADRSHGRGASGRGVPRRGGRTAATGGAGAHRRAGTVPGTSTGPTSAEEVHAARLARDLLSADRRESATTRRARHTHPAPGSSRVGSTEPGDARPGGAPASGARATGEQSGDHRADDAPDDAADVSGTPDPVLSLALLREAAADGREVWLEMVGAEGAVVRRKVRPVRVDAGRVRAVDTEREAELTVAVHRIATVTPLPH